MQSIEQNEDFFSGDYSGHHSTLITTAPLCLWLGEIHIGNSSRSRGEQEMAMTCHLLIAQSYIFKQKWEYTD